MHQIILLNPVLQSTLHQPSGHEYFTDTFSLVLIALVFFISSFGIIFYIRFREKGKINRRLEKEISIKEKSEEALRISEAKFRETNATKDKFFSILSHDLKSPFAAIMGMAELLEKEYTQLSEADRIMLVKELGNATRNTYDLFQELLIWSQSQRGLLDFNPIPTNLFKLCMESIEVVGAAAANKSIDINCRVEEDIFVDADHNMLSTIIRNLFTNAIKFTNQGGKIELQSQKIEAMNNKGQLSSMVMVGVSDNGVGISPENIGRLLKIDDKFKSYGTEKESGTGLGLIICQEFVEKHGGTISIESEEGKGSTFSFTVPEAGGEG
jgi:signal transduction histidine kinase